MPISKRDKEVSLTKVKKDVKKRKIKLFETIQSSLKNYEHVAVLDINNTRGIMPTELRQNVFRTSRIFCGKIKMMALALGKSKENELENDLHKLSRQLKGKCALLFTNEPPKKLIEFFKEYIYNDYLKAGSVATKDVTLPKGYHIVLDGKNKKKQFEKLKDYNLSISQVDYVSYLSDEYVLCKFGDVLSKKQEEILKILQIKLANNKIELLALWERNKGFSKLK